MSRWTREEMESALDKFKAATWKGAQTRDWRDWSECFTEDVTYFCHKNGRFWGRARVLDFISELMSQYPLTHMTAFPVPWYSIDVEKGWIFLSVLNRMQDLGDAEIYEEHNLTILHYAGNGLFSYEEDAFNPERMVAMIARWQAAKDRLEASR